MVNDFLQELYQKITVLHMVWCGVGGV